jgi:hypothetical protein
MKIKSSGKLIDRSGVLPYMEVNTMGDMVSLAKQQYVKANWWKSTDGQVHMASELRHIAKMSDDDIKLMIAKFIKAQE